ALRGRAGCADDLDVDVRLSSADASVHGIDATLAAPAHIRMEAGRVTDVRLDVNVGAMALQLVRTGRDGPLQIVANGQLPLTVPGLAERPVVAMDARIDGWNVDIARASARWGDTTAEATALFPVSFFEPWLPAALQAELGEDADPGPPATARLEVRSVPVGAVTRWLYPEITAPAGAVDVVLDAEAGEASLDAVRLAGRIEHGWVETAGVRLAQEGNAAVTLQDRIASVSGWRFTAPG